MQYVTIHHVHQKYLFSKFSTLKDFFFFPQKPEDCAGQGTGVFQVPLSGEEQEAAVVYKD